MFKDKSSFKSGFNLVAHEISMKFLCNNPKEASKWYLSLKKNCEVVLVHLSRDIEVGKLIRKGACAKSHIGKIRALGLECEVKYIPKQILFEKRSILVNNL